MSKPINYTCSECGQEYEECLALTFNAPDNYADLSPEDKASIAELTEDSCIIRHPDQTDRFIRCTLTQTVNDYCEDLDYGVWISASEKSFEDYTAHYHDKGHPGGTMYFGWLCNDIPGYTFEDGIPTTAHTRPDHQRPEIVPHQETDHPFVHD